MVRIETIDANSTHLDAVMRLWRANSHSPRGAAAAGLGRAEEEEAGVGAYGGLERPTGPAMPQSRGGPSARA